jgi:hypothetical protein
MQSYARFSGGLGKGDRMATRLRGATLNLSSAHEVLNARDQELSDRGAGHPAPGQRSER